MSQSIQMPFLDHLGAHITRWAENEAELTLTVQPHHANQGGIAHGGVLATLLDSVCGCSGIYTEEPDALDASTITLSINYLAKAQIDDELVAHGWRTGGGRRIFFTQAELRKRDGTLIATASGAFRYVSQR